MHTSDVAVDLESPFPSSSAMNAAYGELLQLRRELDDTPKLLVAIRKFVKCGQKTGYLLDDSAARRAAQSQIDFWANVYYRVDGAELTDTLLADFDESVRPELPDSACPYVGMDAFGEGQAGLFFGRTELVDALLKKLRENSLITLVGSSGCGKSSVLFAGLLPRLRAGALSDGAQSHCVLTMLPGSQPLTSLAKVVQQCTTPANGSHGVDEIAQELRAEPASFGRMLYETGCVPAILVVDQLEELFTLCADFDTRDAFISCLVSMLDAPYKDNRVILTLRVDFLDRANTPTSPEFQKLFKQGEVLVSPLNRSELRDAIEKPAELAGLVIEPEVVKALVDGLRTEPAALPLLQFTLLKLWEKRERNRVTYRTYRNLGGWSSVLESSAEELYTALTPQDQEAARVLLVNLVKPGTGEEYTRTRRLVSELHALLAPDRVDHVINKFVEARLLHRTFGATPVDDQVEVAHEALIRNWSRYRDWLHEERAAIDRRGMIEQAAKQWAQAPADHRADFLWTGARLAGVESYADLSAEESEFVKASVESYTASLTREKDRLHAEEMQRQREEELRKDKLHAEEMQRQREEEFHKDKLHAEQIQRQKEEELRIVTEKNRALSRSRNFLKVLSGFLAIVLLLVGVLAIFVVRANIKSLALNSRLIDTREPFGLQRATLVATEAVGLSRRLYFFADEDPLEALRDLLARFDGYPLMVDPPKAFGRLPFAYSTQRGIVAASDTGGSVYLWNIKAVQPSDVQQSDLRGTKVPLDVGTPLSLDFGSNLLAVGGDKGAFVVDVSNWPTGTVTSIPVTSIQAEGPVSAVAVSPDDAAVGLISQGGRLELFALDSDSILSHRILSEQQHVSSTLEFSPDGQWLALVDNNNILNLWDVHTMNNKPVLACPNNGVFAFSPDGHWLAARDVRNLETQFWDLASLTAGGWQCMAPAAQALQDPAPNGTANEVTALVFSPHSLHLLAGTKNGSVVLWVMPRSKAPGKDDNEIQRYPPIVFAVNGGMSDVSPALQSRIATKASAQSDTWIATTNPDGTTIDFWPKVTEAPETQSGASAKDGPQTYDSGLETPIRQLVFGQSTDIVIAQAEDGAIRLITLNDIPIGSELSPEALQELACLTVGRPLTRIEEETELGWTIDWKSVCEKIVAGAYE